MVYCVAYNCKTRSGQGIGMFEFPKDEKRRKLWTVRVKRKDFTPSKTARLCAKHFTNEQFVVNPLFAASIGYKMKKLLLKADAEPTVFDFSKQTKEDSSRENGEKKKNRKQSGAVAKRRRIETLAEVLNENECDNKSSEAIENTAAATDSAENTETGSVGDNQNACTSMAEAVNRCDLVVSGGMSERYNAYIQTDIQKILVTKHVGCQIGVQNETVGTQTTIHNKTSTPVPELEEICEVENVPNDSDTDPDWTPFAEGESTENISPDKTPDPIGPKNERKFVIFENNLDELLQQECVQRKGL